MEKVFRAGVCRAGERGCLFAFDWKIDLFNLEGQAEDARGGSRERGSAVHLVVYGGKLGGREGFNRHARSAFPFDWPSPRDAVEPRNGLATEQRPSELALALGRLEWGGRRGELVLAPQTYAMDANHLIFRWRDDQRQYSVSLHAWEPFLQTVATLRRIVESIPSAGAPLPALRRFERYGIRFDYPHGWYVTARPLSNAAQPAYRFAVGTFPARRTREDIGPCLAGIGRQRPPDGVLAFLREATGADKRLDRLSPRPASFRLPGAEDNTCCCLPPGSSLIIFRDAGRAFMLWISVGPEATEATRAALRRLLDGLVIRPR